MTNETPTLAEPAASSQETRPAQAPSAGEGLGDIPQAGLEPGDPGPAEGAAAQVADTETPRTATGEGDTEAGDGTEQPAEAEALPEGWEAHPSVGEKLKAIKAEEYNRAKGHLSKTHQADLEELEETYRAETQRIQHLAPASAAVQRFADVLTEIDISEDNPQLARQLSRVLEENEPWAHALNGAYKQVGQSAVASALTQSEAYTAGLSEPEVDELNAEIAELRRELRRDLARARTDSQRDAAFSQAVAEAVARRDKIRDRAVKAQAIAEEKARLEKLAKENARAEGKAAEREERGGQPPRPAGAGGAGAKSYATLEEARKLHAANQISNEEMRRAKTRFAGQ
jgi:hypothetical protein